LTLRAGPEGDRATTCEDVEMSATVLIADDHAGFRSRARALLRLEGYDVVGEAADGASALSVARRLRPDLVLLDVRLPDIDGFEIARQLARDDPPPTVILISSRDAADYGGRIAGSGAIGFITKAELSGSSLAALLAPGR
jgi:DNA-binding NarL/FixJ family response regulator